MKAKIITLQCVANYGTQLQAYATQEKLKTIFDDVSFINYKREDTYGKGLLKLYAKGNIFRAMAIIPSVVMWKIRFSYFQKKYLNIDKKVYTTDKDFLCFEADADVYITGSDQVWNSGWNQGIKKMMYLDFVSDNKPIYGYAVSFGKTKLDSYEIKNTKSLIHRYRSISVREESGYNILRDQYSYNNCYMIVDPTLAFSGDWWRNIALKYKKRINEPYILIYCLNRNDDLDIYVKKLGMKLNTKVYRFCTRFDQVLKCGKSLIIPDILDFINLIDNAELVVTDSFHATAFAMNLNTEPICVYPKDYSSRIGDFLKILNATNRRLKNYEDFDIVNRHVDFERINSILNKERQKIDEYLSMIKEDAEVFYDIK